MVVAEAAVGHAHAVHALHDAVASASRPTYSSHSGHFLTGHRGGGTSFASVDDWGRRHPLQFDPPSTKGLPPVYDSGSYNPFPHHQPREYPQLEEQPTATIDRRTPEIYKSDIDSFVCSGQGDRVTAGPHPEFMFTGVARRVHVTVVDETTGKLHWDAGFTLSKSLAIPSVKLGGSLRPTGGLKPSMEKLCVPDDDPMAHKYRVTIRTDDLLKKGTSVQTEGFRRRGPPAEMQLTVQRFPVTKVITSGIGKDRKVEVLERGPSRFKSKFDMDDPRYERRQFGFEKEAATEGTSHSYLAERENFPRMHGRRSYNVEFNEPREWEIEKARKYAEHYKYEFPPGPGPFNFLY